jgi:hypothetical protein
MINLISDRTSSDVAQIETLRKKVKNNTATAAELSEWLTSLKGAYNYTDLNRVGEAIKTLAALLNGYGYINSIEPKTDWEVGDKPNQEQMEKYLSDLQKLKDTYYVYPTTPQVPDDMVSLNYEEANNIEKILVDIEEIMNKMVAVYRYSNTFYSNGMEGLI